uniref:Origin recognition complex subunit 3 N-terminal domain-containing protein n=1 Tax=Parascaris univalens TaxID=6257 RepID=A0A915B9C2_PARUN
MDHCVFIKGKRKLLSERGGGNSHRVSKQARRCEAFHRFMPAFEGLIDSTISDLYRNVLSEIAEFVQAEWRSTRSRCGVVCCENVDGISLSHSLTELLGKEPICISAPTPPLYTLVDLMRKNKEPKCFLLKQVECLPGDFIDSFISILCDPDWDCKFVLLMTISADMSVVYSRCSRESYTQLAIRRFKFPSPLMALNAFLDAVTFHSHSAVRVDGKLFDELRASYLEKSFSTEQLKKMVRLAVLHFFTTTEDHEIDAEECSPHIERYVLFMRLLYDLCDGLPLQAESIYELHSKLQWNASFFTDRDGLFSEWKSVWLTWDVEQVKAAVNKLLPHLKEFDDELYAELESLLLDVENLEARKSAMYEKISVNASADSPSESRSISESKLSYSVMQHRLKEKMAAAKKLDLFTSDRQRFIKLLTKVFRTVLKPFDAVDALKGGLLRGGASLSTLTAPCIREHLEGALAGSSLHEKKVDLCVAYRTLQRLALYKKSIRIAEWAHHFEEETHHLEGVDPSTRLYKCIADLELMGVIKAASDSCVTAVQLLQPPSTLVVDTA